jgi:nucleoside-diphosphate-sugar epimerase
MKVAVTGANGFVGSHVSACLANRPDIEATLCHRSLHEKTNIANFRYAKFDMADADQNTFENLGSPDALIHLAWGGLPNYNSDFHLQHELPVQIQFLTHLIKSGLKRLIITGTCYEYGMQSGVLTEESPIVPITKYGQAKAMLHAALVHLNHEHEFELVWIRLFYLYGTGQAKSSLYAQLQDAMTAQKSAFDMSGGEQIRDFMAIEKAAERIIAISVMPGTSGTFNLCSGKPIKIKEIVGQWITEGNSAITMNLGYYPYPTSEPMAFWGSNTSIEATLKLSVPKPKTHVRDHE